MRQRLLEKLTCPACRTESVEARGTIGEEGELGCPACGAVYPVKFGIPALVDSRSPLYAAVAADVKRPSRVSGATDADRQRDYWESDLGHREASHPIVEGFSRQRWEHISRLLPMESIRTALDVGAGNGFSTAYMPPGIDTIASDGSWHMLRRHPGEDTVLADAQWLPFPDNSFDLVFCWELLHHLDEPWRVIGEMARVTRKWVLIMEPNPVNLAQFLFALADPEHRWVLRFSRGYVHDQIEKAGLTPERYERVGIIFPNKTPGWLYPILRAVPFRIPLVGISQLMIASKTV